MNFEEFVEKKKSIQNALLEFLDDESDADDKFENFVNLVTSQPIIKNQHDFKELLYLIYDIGNYRPHVPKFISKVERVLRQFKQYLQQYFSNSEIFKIFKSNKRILLFLLEEKLMIIDESIFSIITNLKYANMNYCKYFQPEINQFLTENKELKDDKFIEQTNKEVEENFYEKRREGQNDDYLCELIRNNEIKEFIKFTEQRNLPLESDIKKSIFETNLLLSYKDKISLIEYASFYGSNDIIKYMEKKGVKLTSHMWIYAIASRNAELIRYLEDNHVSCYDYEDILSISIECHYNEISNYIIDNLIKEEDLQDNIENQCEYNLYQFACESRNYCFFPTDMKYKNMFFYLCKYDYFTLVKLYLSEGTIDINATIRMLSI
ncbi:hypothetical protein M9Y10_030764 [Tritrichomonas musculus]|uniref:DUF3447 domain-containing protein n=1 Tax=Tritrichomonas musculus TaxID=1915356 RepID=A0ABR2H317_9EUKA